MPNVVMSDVTHQVFYKGLTSEVTPGLPFFFKAAFLVCHLGRQTTLIIFGTQRFETFLVECENDFKTFRGKITLVAT